MKYLEAGWSCLLAGTKYLTKVTEGGIGLLWFTVLGHSVHLVEESVAGEDGDCQAHPQAGSREGQMLVLSSFLLFRQSWTTAHGLVLLEFRVDRPTSTKLT